MAYKDKEEEKRKKREWVLNNPDKVKAMRERENERRRQKRLSDPEYLKKERIQKRMNRLNMTEEEVAIYDALKLEEKRKYSREWAKNHPVKNRHEKTKERMKNDPEFAAQMREKWRISNAKRSQKALDETPEQREKRLQRLREERVKKAKEKALMKQLEPVIKVIQKEKPKEKPKYNPKTNPNFKKPGRLAMMAKWNRY